MLAYHRFGSIRGSTTVDPAVFEAQIAAIRARHIPIQPLSSALAERKKTAVAITVDDGHASVFTTLFPIIQRLRVPVTLFLYPSAISRAGYALTWKQIDAMRATGLVDVQSHTLWHPDFNHERSSRSVRGYARFVENQLSASRSILEKRLARPVTVLAWPYGIHDEFLERKAEQAGYAAAFTVEPRAIHSGDDAFRLPRFVAPNSAGPAFERILDAAGHVYAIDSVSKAPIPDATVTTAGGKVMIRAPGYRRFEGAVPPGAVELVPIRVKALYLSTFGMGDAQLREQALARMGKAGLNALVIDIKGDRGLVGYPSKVALASTAGAQRRITMPNLAAFVAERRAVGDYLIGRIVVFKDTLVAHAEPALAIKTKTGEPWLDHEDLAWTDPFQPSVREYNIALAEEAAQLGFDDIQFDYVRFPDRRDLVYAKPDTAENRMKAIEEFLREARNRLAPYNVFVSADVFGYVCWNTNDTGIGQQLERLMPLVDYLSPMLYPSAFHAGIPGIREPLDHPREIVQRSLERARERTSANPLRFRPWLQAFRDYAFDHREFSGPEIAEQIRAGEEFGASGWMVWNPHNIYPEF